MSEHLRPNFLFFMRQLYPNLGLSNVGLTSYYYPHEGPGVWDGTMWTFPEIPFVDNSTPGDGNGGTGVSGETEETGPTISFNNIVRYAVDTVAGQTVHVVSSSTFFNNLSWTRTGTVLTMSRVSHGRSVGERVILRNVSVDLLPAVITSATANSFSVACLNTGATSGTSGAYTCGLTFSHNGPQGSISSGEIIAPANSDVQLLSMRLHLKSNSRVNTNYVLTAPASVISVLNGSTNSGNAYIPVHSIRQDADTLSAVANTLYMNYGGVGNYAAFQFGALPLVTTGIIIAITF